MVSMREAVPSSTHLKELALEMELPLLSMWRQHTTISWEKMDNNVLLVRKKMWQKFKRKCVRRKAWLWRKRLISSCRKSKRRRLSNTLMTASLRKLKKAVAYSRLEGQTYKEMAVELWTFQMKSRLPIKSSCVLKKRRRNAISLSKSTSPSLKTILRAELRTSALNMTLKEKNLIPKEPRRNLHQRVRKREKLTKIKQDQILTLMTKVKKGSLRQVMPLARGPLINQLLTLEAQSKTNRISMISLSHATLAWWRKSRLKNWARSSFSVPIHSHWLKVRWFASNRKKMTRKSKKLSSIETILSEKDLKRHKNQSSSHSEKEKPSTQERVRKLKSQKLSYSVLK